MVGRGVFGYTSRESEVGVFVTLTTEKWAMRESGKAWIFVESEWNWLKIGVEGNFWNLTGGRKRVVMLRVCFFYASLNNHCRSLVGVW